MHLEILVEELSAQKALENLLPKLDINEHTFRFITYQGKNDMLRKIPGRLRGYSNFIPDDWVIVLLIDLDKENCIELKEKLNHIASASNLKIKSETELQNERYQILNRIAIEELESWFIGDPEAVELAFPRIRKFANKSKYRIPDTIINPSETLERILQQAGYYSTGIRKVDVANKISVYMQPLKNKSKSFQIFWDGVYNSLNQVL